MKAGASPRVIPPPRRPTAKELSSLPREGSTARVASPQAPPRWRDETLSTPLSKPAEPPQQVSRATAPPVRRSNTPVQATRPPPPVRAPPSGRARSIQAEPLNNENPSGVAASAAPQPLQTAGGPMASNALPSSASAVDDIRRGRASGGEDDVPLRGAAASSNNAVVQQPLRGAAASSNKAVVQQAQSGSNVTMEQDGICPPPREGPAGPSRDLSLRQAQREAQRPTPHSIVAQTTRTGNAPYVPGDHRTTVPNDGGSPTAPTLVGCTRRRATLADSPSSPSAGKRSVLPPTHTFALCANTDVPICDNHQSHLPSEHVAMPRHDASQNESTDGGAIGVQAGHRGTTAAIQATLWESFRQPVQSPPQKPLPPPAIQPSGCQARDPQVYGPTPTKWECLDQFRRTQGASTDADGSSVEDQQAASAPAPTKLFNPQQQPPMLGDADTVTCVVQVVCSESHYLRDELFDPVSEVRFSRCDLSATSVRRLVELVHMSLNFRPTKRGILRCFEGENAPGLLSNARGSGGRYKHIPLSPETARLAAFLDAAVFQSLKRSEDRVVRLRWVEDGQLPVTIETSTTPATPTQRTDAAMPARTYASTKGTRSDVGGAPATLEGFRIEVPDSQGNTKPASMVHTPSASNGTFTANTANPVPATTTSSGTGGPSTATSHEDPSAPLAIPVFCVPSRSQSATSTPNVSPVRSGLIHGFLVGGSGGASQQGTTASGRQTPADTATRPFDVQREMLLSAAEGQRRFDGQQHAASAGTVRRTPAAAIAPAAASSASSSANVSRSAPASQSSSVMIDGVAYTPKSPRAQKLAQEIAALRAAIYSDEGRLALAQDRLTQQQQQQQQHQDPLFDDGFERASY